MFLIFSLLSLSVLCQQDSILESTLRKSIEDFILSEEFNSDFKLSRKSLEKLMILFPDYVKNSLEVNDRIVSVLVICYYDWDSMYDNDLRRELFKIQEYFGPKRLVILAANLFFSRSFTNYFQVFTSPSILILSRGSGFHNYKGIRNSELMVPFLHRFLLNESQIVPSFEEELRFREFLKSEEYAVYQILHLEKDENEDEDDSFWEFVYDEDYVDPFLQAAKYLRHVSFCRVITDSDIMSHKNIFLHFRETKEKLLFRSSPYGEEVGVEELIDWVETHAPTLVHDLTRRTFQEFLSSQTKQNVLMLFYRDFKTRESAMASFKEVARQEFDHFHFSFASLDSYEELLRRLVPRTEQTSDYTMVLMDWKNKEHHECRQCVSMKNGEVEVDHDETMSFLQRYRKSCRSYGEVKVDSIYQLMRYSGLSSTVSQLQYLKNRLPEFLVYFKRRQCLHCEVFEKKVLHRTVHSRFSQLRPKGKKNAPLMFITIDCELENCNRIEGVNIEFLPYVVYHSEGSNDVYKGTYDHVDFLRWIEDVKSGEKERNTQRVTLSFM